MNDVSVDTVVVPRNDNRGIDLVALTQAIGSQFIDLVTDNSRVSIRVHDDPEGSLPEGKVRISVLVVEYEVLGRYRRDDSQVSRSVLVDRIQQAGNLILKEETLTNIAETRPGLL